MLLMNAMYLSITVELCLKYVDFVVHAIGSTE